MRPIGFSTGALAYADFRRGLAMVSNKKLKSIELSALRQNELMALLDALPTLDLSGFEYISLHAPSQYEPAWEETLCARLQAEAWRSWPVVVHPDAINDFGLWRRLENLVCIENMDKRKLIGRTVSELTAIFEQLPDATFCFDIGHARQIDLTMTKAYLTLREFGSKLTQAHVSEVNARSKHDPLSYSSILVFQEVAHLIPAPVPLILETPVLEEEMEPEIARVREALPLNLRTMVA
jgi:hypothetical protein